MILGADPGLATFGAVLVRLPEMIIVKVDVFDMPATPKKKRPRGERMVRVRELANWLVGFIGGYRPAVCATEALAGSRGIEIAMSVGAGFGVLSGVLATLNIPSIAAQPREWRSSLVIRASELAGDELERLSHEQALRRFGCHNDPWQTAAANARVSRAELLAEIDEDLEAHALDALGVAAWACTTPFVTEMLATKERQLALRVLHT